jgi:DNA-binding transcriptional MerR regulator
MSEGCNSLNEMNIDEFARKCGLPIHTLRYYEKIGLLPEIACDGGNRRQYCSRDAVCVGRLFTAKDAREERQQAR